MSWIWICPLLDRETGRPCRVAINGDGGALVRAIGRHVASAHPDYIAIADPADECGYRFERILPERMGYADASSWALYASGGGPVYYGRRGAEMTQERARRLILSGDPDLAAAQLRGMPATTHPGLTRDPFPGPVPRDQTVADIRRRVDEAATARLRESAARLMAPPAKAAPPPTKQRFELLELDDTPADEPAPSAADLAARAKLLETE